MIIQWLSYWAYINTCHLGIKSTREKDISVDDIMEKFSWQIIVLSIEESGVRFLDRSFTIVFFAKAETLALGRGIIIECARSHLRFVFSDCDERYRINGGRKISFYISESEI